MSLVYNKTPLLKHFFPGKNLPQFYLKYESLQPSGSFKSRGIGNLILKNAIRIKKINVKKPYVFSSSGGNAGLAAATASQRLSLPCTVVVPTATKERMVQKIRATGANVIIKGNHWKEADNFLKQNIMNEINKDKIEPIYVHPFDNPLIWEGHSTMVDEIMETFSQQKFNIKNLKAIVCSVGGGGLYNGIIQGLEKYNLADKIPVVGVETQGCHVFNTSLKLNKPVEFTKISTIATSLGTANISNQMFDYAKKYNTKSVVVEDKDVVETCLKFTHDHNMVIEPACGAAIHLGYHTDLLETALGTKLTCDDAVLIVACGGSSNTVKELETALLELNLKSQKASPTIPSFIDI
ncbi:hypothetical protein Kpol_2002p6 [Vanderwaltozyma polyspora DSM 70294]|uniref:L-serine dehydratase n=1 Tax=Vanderwaltozyma polyspora (strain ATCC 22028 / DSM 70294 / BCRC 21397 / CBS 2163 / NBRC 10782 / NRRL Y-8283 / UCD 57-17) TaxID=436907 RepID=A7TFC2_VANPO|nr:uncharacterized protein Kpol_2002p6 [Vanderwaltozyma polyspora DSM 70294]EDO18936.1 hypothetical protein Kpol_2002p6 [Vanderwaltozyma polyspora DSM 70294]